tara:strand:+ start:389 stop:586 length:198 start_codon:yes stop_codon:yes gene_type:complete
VDLQEVYFLFLHYYLDPEILQQMNHHHLNLPELHLLRVLKDFPKNLHQHLLLLKNLKLLLELQLE